jgi:hypothetical protein
MGPALGLRLRNLAIAVGTTGLVAGPWYLANARSVYDLLLGSGYGEGAAQFGHHYHVASWGYWTKELRLDVSYMWLPLAVALLACFGVAFAYFLAHGSRPIRVRRLQSAHAAAVLALVLVVLEGYIVLTSSRNEGTGFALPWLPALVVLGVTAAASVPTQAIRVVLAGSLVVVSLSALIAKSGWFEPLAKTRTVAVPGLGHVLITEGRGLIQREVEGDGYDITPVTHPLPTMHRRWLPLAHDVVGWSLRRAHERGAPLHLTLGVDDRIFGNSRLTLAAQLWFHQYLPVDYLSAFPGGDSIASFHRQLQPENALITAEPPPSGSTITRSKVEAAARALGFVQVRSFVMPDGRTLWVWWREDGSNS